MGDRVGHDEEEYGDGKGCRKSQNGGWTFFALSAAVSTLHPLLVLGILYRISVFVLPTVLPSPIVVGILLLSATLVVIFCPPKGWWWLLMMCMLLSLILELEVIWMDLCT